MKAKKALILIVTPLVLAACGGGGGASTSTPTPTPTPVPTPTPSAARPDAINTMPGNTYADPETASMFTTLNEARIGSGAGALEQNSKLDSAAKAHSDYIANNHLAFDTDYVTNPAKGFHWEDAGLPGFTGATSGERVSFAGYLNGSAENLTASLGSGPSSGENCVRNLVEQTVYHRASLLQPANDIGLGRSIDLTGGQLVGTLCVAEVGIPSGSTVRYAADVVAYPFQGQTGVINQFVPQSETPNPLPDVGNSAVGIPILVSLYAKSILPDVDSALNGSDVIVTGFSISPHGGSAVAGRILVASGVTGSGVTVSQDSRLQSGMVFFVPLTPLQSSQTYTVTFTATVKGKAVSKNWSFTTGSF